MSSRLATSNKGRKQREKRQRYRKGQNVAGGSQERGLDNVGKAVDAGTFDRTIDSISEQKQQPRFIEENRSDGLDTAESPTSTSEQQQSSSGDASVIKPMLAAPSSSSNEDFIPEQEQQAPQSKMCSQRAVAIIKAVLFVGFVAGLAAAAIGSAGLGLLPTILGFAKIGSLSFGVSLGLTIGGGVSLLSAFAGGSYMVSKNGLFSKKAEGVNLISSQASTQAAKEVRVDNTIGDMPTLNREVVSDNTQSCTA